MSRKALAAGAGKQPAASALRLTSKKSVVSQVLRRVRAAGALQEIHPASAAWLNFGGPGGETLRCVWIVRGQTHLPHLACDLFRFDLQLGVFASQSRALQR